MWRGSERGGTAASDKGAKRERAKSIEGSIAREKKEKLARERDTRGLYPFVRPKQKGPPS